MPTRRRSRSRRTPRSSTATSGVVEVRRKDLPEAERNLRKARGARPGRQPARWPASADVLEERGNLDGRHRRRSSAPTRSIRSDAVKRRLDRLRERSRTSGLPPEYAAIPAPGAGHARRRGGAHRRPAAGAAGGRHAAARPRWPPTSAGTGPPGGSSRSSRAGVMDVFANHTFQPRAVVRRSDLAQAVEPRPGALRREPEPGRAGVVSPSRTCGASHLELSRTSPTAVAAGVLSLEGGQLPPVARRDGAGGRRRGPPPRAAGARGRAPEAGRHDGD
ncbi:MAG: hypothetical protein MZV64_72945 [Ignavibacteriales bacterium]|nr:hypothetical protein [Ignavibacteriales bacterium]